MDMHVDCRFLVGVVITLVDRPSVFVLGHYRRGGVGLGFSFIGPLQVIVGAWLLHIAHTCCGPNC